MKVEVIQKFKGIIDGVVIENEGYFNTAEYVLELMEQHYNQDSSTFPDNFVSQVLDVIETAYISYDFSLAAIESLFENNIKKVQHIEDFRLRLPEDNRAFQWFNHYMDQL